VILLSIDGAPANTIKGYIADGTMPNLASLVGQGASAEYALSINPSLTAAAQNSITTGSLPRHTGIVSNRFHLSNDSFYWYQDGFSTPLDNAEPVWKTAQKAGLRTAAVFFVGGTPDLPKQMADYTIGYGRRDVYSNELTATFTYASTWDASRVPKSFSPLKQARLDIASRGSTVATPMLLAVDTTDNGQADYDTFYLCEKTMLTKECATLKSDGSWGSFVVNRNLVSGGDFKITDPDLDHFVLFQGAIDYNIAEPVELARAINARFGFFPPSPDYYALEHGWISAEDYIHTAQRQSSYQMDVAIWIWQTYQPDLMFVYQAPIDEAQHQFLLVNPDQPGYSEAKAKEFDGYRRRAAKIVDDNLGHLLKAVDLNTTTIMVTSDHGMAPIKAEVNVNTILENAGLLKLYAGNTDVDVSNTQAIGFSSGGAAHIYINVRGRERAGIVPRADVPAVTQKIISAFKEARDLKTGEPLFARIVDRTGLAELGLDSPASGDVFVQGAPGYGLTDNRGVADVVTPVTYFGQHGFDPTWPELHAIFYAAGRGIKPGPIGPVKLIDIAPTIAKLLGFQPAATVDGKAIDSILNP
jgi:predicted AlkP superfamily phosphohydrolase/phosphomutase